MYERIAEFLAKTEHIVAELLAKHVTRVWERMDSDPDMLLKPVDLAVVKELRRGNREMASALQMDTATFAPAMASSSALQKPAPNKTPNKQANPAPSAGRDSSTKGQSRRATRPSKPAHKPAPMIQADAILARAKAEGKRADGLRGEPRHPTMPHSKARVGAKSQVPLSAASAILRDEVAPAFAT